MKVEIDTVVIVILVSAEEGMKLMYENIQCQFLTMPYHAKMFKKDSELRKVKCFLSHRVSACVGVGLLSAHVCLRVCVCVHTHVPK